MYHDLDAMEWNEHTSQIEMYVRSCCKLPTADPYSGGAKWLQGIASSATVDGNGEIIHAPVKPLRLLKVGFIRTSCDNN